MKKLKLRIVKFNQLLVVEQLEREGVFEDSEHVFICSDMFLTKPHIDLPENSKYMSANSRSFSSNEERDEYAANLVKWITEEQFGGSGKLEIGKPCLVCDDGMDWLNGIYAGSLKMPLGENYFCTLNSFVGALIPWRYAKPLNFTQPKIDGEIYTWEIK